MAKACSFFLAFIYQIYYITAMLVIIFAYIIHTIMAKSTIQHIKKTCVLKNVNKKC